MGEDAFPEPFAAAACGRDAAVDGAALKRLILPLILEQTLAITVGMADHGDGLVAGDAVMSGVSLIDNINTLIINIFAAFATGGAVVAAQFLGARREKSARETAGQVIVSTLLISLAVMGVCLARASRSSGAVARSSRR